MSKEYPQIKNKKMLIHLSMTRQHQRKDSGEIVWPGNPIDGKIIMIETITKKTPKTQRFTKVTNTYYISEPDSPMFDDVEKFISHYQIPKP